MQKYALVRNQLEQDTLLSCATFMPSPLATRLELEAVHDASYLRRVMKGELSKREIREVGLPWSTAGVRRALASTGGTVAAMRCVLEGARVAGQLAGGTHHARRDGGAGFCVFNDIAVAAAIALSEGKRVAVLDFDVHQGDGTAEIFKDMKDLYTVSLHAEHNYPFEKIASDIDIGFEDGVGDEEYLEVVKDVVPRVLDGFDPDIVMLQMGVDGLESDGLGRLSLTRQGLSRRNRYVYESILEREMQAVVTMGGGYSRPSIWPSVEAHCDVYTDIARVLQQLTLIGV